MKTTAFNNGVSNSLLDAVGKVLSESEALEENLEELSKDTLSSYIKKSAADGMASGYLSNKKNKNDNLDKSSKRLKGINKAVKKLATEELTESKKLEQAKKDLSTIISREHDRKIADRKTKTTEVHNHFQKQAPKILKDHGYTKVHSANDHSVYHKGHDNGHSTVVRIAHKPNKSDYHNYGSKFSVHSSNGSGTIMGHDHRVDHKLSHEENKIHAVHGFRDSLISHDKSHKQSYTFEETQHEELESLIEIATAEDLDQLDELSKKTLANYTKKSIIDIGNTRYNQGKTAERIFSSGKYKSGDAESYKKDQDKTQKRHSGIIKASEKLAKEELTIEDFETMTNEEKEEFLNSQLDELSKNKDTE